MSDVWAGPDPKTEDEAVEILAAGYDVSWRGIYVMAKHDGEDVVDAHDRLSRVLADG